MVSYLATALLAVSVLAEAPQSLEWQADYGDALAATRAGDQPLLVVLDEPKAEDARVEPALLGEDGATAKEAKLLKPYRLCHVDVSTEYGRKIAKAFRAKRFPHVAIIDRSGSVVIYKKSGKIDASEWSNALETHKDGNRVAARHVSYKLNGDENSPSEATPVYRNNSYCPSCQRRSM